MGNPDSPVDFEAVFAAAPARCAVVDQDGLVRAATDAWLAAAGLTRAEALGRTLPRLPDHDRRIERPVGPLVVHQYAPIEDAPPGDLAARVQASKMEAIGRLAGAVAHDFNNMLSVILTYADILHTELGASPHRADVEEIAVAARRAADLTSQLLAFSRQQMLTPRVTTLGEILDGLARVLTQVAGEGVVLDILGSDDTWPVEIDPGPLEQVLVNLVANARDAMPEGGRIVIETANVELDADGAAGHPGVEPGPYVRLSVTDDGSGMDRQTVDRIFEPFFTTKARGRGTGLGLASVFGTVRQHGGHVWANSEPGVGTTLRILLPRATGPIDEAYTAPEVTDLTGTEVVLLCEDDDQVRAAAALALRRRGYTVIAASDAWQALAACASDAAIDVLLTDVVMPGMGGRELARRAAEVRPELPVVFMSGYAENGGSLVAVTPNARAFVPKPYTPESLAGTLRQVLDAAVRG